MSEPTSTLSQEVKSKRYERTTYRNCGKKISKDKIREIFRLRALGWNKTAIGRELNLSWTTIDKYCTKGENKANCVPSKPIDEQVAEVNRKLEAVRDYNLEQSFLKTLNLVSKAKELVFERMENGGFVQQVTPLMVKQLAEAERLIVTTPGELHKQHRDIYKQIAERENEVTEAEYEELREAGDLD